MKPGELWETYQQTPYPQRDWAVRQICDSYDRISAAAERRWGTIDVVVVAITSACLGFALAWGVL